jgi:hypothetical protein
VVEAGSGDLDRDSPHLAAAIGAGREGIEVLAGEVAVVGDREAEQQLRVGAGREADREGTQLVGSVRLDRNRLPAEPVQAHQGRERAGPVRPAAEATGDRRRVDGMVEVGVADEDAGDLAGRMDEAVERRGIGQRRPAPQQVGEGDAGDVGIDEERLSLKAHPVAGDAKPFELEPGRQLQWPLLELAESLSVFALGALSLQPSAGQLGEMPQRARHGPAYAVSIAADSSGGRERVWKTTQ